MVGRVSLVLALVSGIAAPAEPCSVIAPLPSPASLVRDAEVVARVRADDLSSQPGRPGVVAESRTQVRFTVLEVLKGQLPSPELEFNGTLSDQDDPNDGRVPYTSIRPNGRGGNCFATAYRTGAEYLFLLRRGEYAPYVGELTPYWAPLGPTNEQLLGKASDPWLVWVRKRVPRRKNG
jgi:hypothetical protein